MIRAFVAIPMPEPVTHALMAAQAGLPCGRPVPAENFHITLAFLGEHPEPLIEDVHFALAGIQAPAFELRLAGLGLFGGERPHQLITEPRREPRLEHLRDKVVQAARGAGLRMERARYLPHVTLARFNNGLRGEEAEAMRAFAARGAGFRAGPFEVGEFVLFRSSLGRRGPTYEELAAYPLQAGPRE
jgi:RNA 2',3'-cyclic 3'-phosphodiesterase